MSVFVDDLFPCDDGTGVPPPAERPIPWPILVVDDDEQVHAMTRLLLKDFDFDGRDFEMLSAHSAAQARAILAGRPDIPVVLLDVVMETPDAGLKLVHHIRRELGNRHIRIILRTGQPGQAPEREVVVAYDINDYRAKNDLTSDRLFTSLVSALRGWRDLTTIECLNRSLEARVAERTAELARRQAVAEEQTRFVENLVELMPSPVWYQEAGGTYRICNRAFRALFGGGMAAEGADPPALGALAPPVAGEEPIPAVETAVMDADGQVREVLVMRKALAGPSGGTVGVVGIAMDITERRRMERELHRLAITDPLSGTFNRRHLLDRVDAALRDMEAGGRPFCLVMLDIDHFKRINDAHGHAAGDEAIRTSVAEIRRHLRASDSVGRIGGEEFAILLPDTTLDAAAGIAERLRVGLAAAAVPLPQGHSLGLTASFGITQARGALDTMEAVLHRADQALYRAKALGRNRIELG